MVNVKYFRKLRYNLSTLMFGFFFCFLGIPCTFQNTNESLWQLDRNIKLYDNDLASMYLNFIQLHKSSDQASQFWPSS